MRKLIFIILALAMVISFSGCSQKEKPKTDDTKKEKLVEEDYNLEVEGGELKGTIAIPKEREFDTIAIIIAGSGPTDRNGNNPVAGDNNSLKMLAYSLAEEGIASIRYDKRGIAASQSLLGKEEDLVFENYIEDVNLWVDKLEKDDRFKNIVIVGHSEGALIGSVSSVEKDIQAYVSIAGVGENAADTLERQLKAQSEEAYNLSKSILDNLRIGKLTENPPKELDSLFRESVQPYLISWFKYDPSEVIGKIEVPVLIIQGENDLQVTVDDAKKLKEANPESKLVLIDKMNHILKDAPKDQAGNMETYNNADLPLNKELVKEISSFIKGL